jgi:hypothetical protein
MPSSSANGSPATLGPFPSRAATGHGFTSGHQPHNPDGVAGNTAGRNAVLQVRPGPGETRQGGGHVPPRQGHRPRLAGADVQQVRRHRHPAVRRPDRLRVHPQLVAVSVPERRYPR